MKPKTTTEIITSAPFVLARAEEALLALDAAVPADIFESREIDRHAARVRFAVERVAELRPASGRDGIFESGRLEVALDILEAHTQRARRVVERARRRTPASPKTHAAVPPSTDTVSDSLVEIASRAA
jgi:hypothetical protein